MKNLVKKYGLLSVALTVLSGAALANSASGGTGGATEFQGMFDAIVLWSEGYLGKLLAIGAFLIGMGMGIVKQSIIAVALGIAFALTLAYGPAIITGVFSFAV
jgi:conjugal transfer pilus assembly protein TraA